MTWGCPGVHDSWGLVGIDRGGVDQTCLRDQQLWRLKRWDLGTYPKKMLMGTQRGPKYSVYATDCEGFEWLQGFVSSWRGKMCKYIDTRGSTGDADLVSEKTGVVYIGENYISKSKNWYKNIKIKRWLFFYIYWIYMRPKKWYFTLRLWSILSYSCNRAQIIVFNEVGQCGPKRP